MKIKNDLSMHQNGINQLKLKAQKELFVKILITTAAIVAGVALITLFQGHFLATGIGIIFISTFAAFQYFDSYRNSKNVFAIAAGEIAQLSSMS